MTSDTLMMKSAVKLLVVLTIFSSSAAWAANRSFEKTVDADLRGRVDISNVAGLVEITGWDKPQVQVIGSLGEHVTRVDVTSTQGRTSIRVVLPRNARRGEAKLRILVPEESQIQLSAVSADVTSKKMLGAQRLKTVSGDISLDLNRDEAELNTVSGDVSVRGVSKPTRLRIETVSGDVRLDKGAGDLEATTVSGDVNAELKPATQVRVRTTSGDIRVNSQLTAKAEVDVETVSGDVNVETGPTNGFRYDMSSFSGDIDTCFDAEVISGRGPGSRSNGELKKGESQAELRLKSLSGDITVCNR